MGRRAGFLKLNSRTVNLFTLFFSLICTMRLSFLCLFSALPFASSEKYEVWASDQSNSVAGQDALGVKGSFLWIWDSDSIAKQLAGNGDATSLSCTPSATVGPCDLMEIFPQTLVETDADNTATGQTLADLPSFGRLHGVMKDPQNLYVNANIFAPGKKDKSIHGRLICYPIVA